MTQDSQNFQSLKCLTFWQMDEYFQNQDIPGIREKPLTWQSAVLGEKLWSKRSPSFQTLD